MWKMAGLLQVTLLTIWLTTLSSGFYTERVRVKPPTATYAWPCPLEVDILPCACISDQNYNLLMDCSKVNNENELSNALHATYPFTDFLQMTIDQEDHNQKLKNISRFTFGDLTFERITISHSDLYWIDENVFDFSYATLKYLDLSYNKLYRFPFETLSNYEVLDTLIIDYNKFRDLPPIVSTTLKTLKVDGNTNLLYTAAVFNDAPALTTISMRNITITKLHQNMFDTLGQIKIINLSDNFIEELDVDSIFAPGHTIDSLTLSNNNINYVRLGAISGLSSTCNFYFRNNDIIDIEEVTWRPIFAQAHSGSIDFSGNPLRCGCDIAWIMLEPNDQYRPLITETTNCRSGEQLISLDINYFMEHCEIV